MLTNLLFALTAVLLRQHGTPPVEKWADSARVAIEVAFAAGRPDAVAEGRRVAEHGLERHPTDPLLLHYQGYGFYREGLLREGGRARRDFEQAREVLERSIAGRDLPESRAVLGAVFGNLISGGVWSAMRFGRSSTVAIDRAVELGPHNPRVWLLKGAGALFAPAMFGGGAEKAEAALRKAIGLFATDAPAAPMPAWGRTEALGWLALALARQNRGAEARAVLVEGLKLEPANAFLVERVQPAVAKLASP